MLGRRQQRPGIGGVRSVLGQSQIGARVQESDLRIRRTGEPDREGGRGSGGVRAVHSHQQVLQRSFAATIWRGDRAWDLVSE